MLFNFITIPFIFLIGTAVGSFINVLEARLYKGEDIFKKPSHCDFCGKRLHVIDLIPIISWLIYRGRSRCCKRKLSWQHPIVELITGIGFVIIFLSNGTVAQWSNVYYFIIFTIAFAAFLQDLKYQAIHQNLLYILIFTTFLGHLFVGTLHATFLQQEMKQILVSVLSSLPFFLIYKLSHEKWLGEGDVWLAFWMGLFLGFPRVLWAIYFGIICGGIVSIFVLLLHLKKLRDTISLGPFLLIGVLICLVFNL